VQAIPAPQAVTPQPSPPAAGQAGASLAGRKALVVDDDFRNIFALTALLERGKLEVVSAESGEEAVALLKRTPDIDIVLVDIMMPVMDGYATMRAIRKLPSGKDLPIVAVTANVAPETRQRCIDAGASTYVAKPVESANLLLVLSEWLTSDEPTDVAPAAAR
jgi:CheY-like chemotaxis protein